MAYVASADELSERDRFRNFYRVSPSFKYTAVSLAQLMRQFGWKKMAIITQQESLFTKVSFIINL